MSANNAFGNKMGGTQGAGLFSQGNMQQKPMFGGNTSGLFTPKTLPSNNNIFGSNPTQGGTFGGTQTNTLNQGGIFGKGPVNTTTNNIMSFNNTSGTSSKTPSQPLTQVFNTGQKPMMGMNTGMGMGQGMGMNSANGVQGASTKQGELRAKYG